MASTDNSNQSNTTGLSDPWFDRTPSNAVVLAVAEAAGLDPIELPPLYDTVNPEALDSVCAGRGVATVTFSYTGFEVEVQAAGHIVVREQADESSG